MLDRVAIRLWSDIASLPATVNDEGAVCRMTNKGRDALDAATRPWMEDLSRQKDENIAKQYMAMFGKDAKENPIVAALRKQQKLIAGITD